MKKNQGYASLLPSGDKTLQGFKKRPLLQVYFEIQYTFPNPIKWKECSIRPLGRKRPVFARVFETPRTVSHTNKMERVFNWTP